MIRRVNMIEKNSFSEKQSKKKIKQKKTEQLIFNYIPNKERNQSVI